MLINNYGFASTVATKNKGTDVGFTHRRSERMLDVYRSRDLLYNYKEPSWLPKFKTPHQHAKFEEPYPGYKTLSYGRAKINDDFDDNLFDLR
jgi:hypothetical protein